VDPAALAADIVRLVGGAGNVTAVTHCFLRLRLELADPALADRDALRAHPGVSMLLEQYGQTQLALRAPLDEVHDAVREMLG
jgi:phosphotransferase system IIB component